MFDVIRWRQSDNPAASLRAESASGTAELILWTSGEADLMHAGIPVSEVVTEHYELTDEVGLHRCLDDLESHLGIVG